MNYEKLSKESLKEMKAQIEEALVGKEKPLLKVGDTVVATMHDCLYHTWQTVDNIYIIKKIKDDYAITNTEAHVTTEHVKKIEFPVTFSSKYTTLTVGEKGGVFGLGKYTSWNDDLSLIKEAVEFAIRVKELKGIHMNTKITRSYD